MPSYYDGKEVNGYVVKEVVREGEYATAYIAEKGGTRYFLKEYSDPPQGAEHYAAFLGQQDEIYKRLLRSGMRCVEELVESFEANYRYHQVKPLYPCTDLAEYLKENWKLDDRLFICRNWLGVLRAVHSQGIVHTDLKQEQILMVKDPGAGRLGYLLMYADFDWAVVDGRQIRSVSTPGYFSPEYLQKQVPTTASDIYQTGIVIYQILTDRHPFLNPGEEFDVETMAERQQRNEFTPAREIQDLPEGIDDILGDMLQWDASRRPGIDDIIGRWKTGASTSASAPAPAPAAAAEAPPAAPPAAAPAPASAPTAASWVRIMHADGYTMTLTEAANPMSRLNFHNPFRKVMTSSGHAVAAYFPSDNSPMFNIDKASDGWVIVGSGHRNKAILNGVTVEGTPVSLGNGAKLEIFAGKDGKVVAEFQVQMG